MGRWLRVSSDVLNDFTAMSLPPAARWRAFVAAVAGEENEMSPFVKIDRASGRLPAAEWADLLSSIFERDNYTCAYCGDRGGRLECDHVVPLARGGSNDPENLVTACFPCNRDKGTKFVGEWLQ